MPEPRGRRVVANLLCEGEFESLVQGSTGPPPRLALATATAAGSLLRVLAGPGDCLHLPAPLDPSRLPEIPGLPTPTLEAGPLDRLPQRTAVAWAETPAVAASRRPGPPPEPPHESSPQRPLASRLWTTPPAEPATVAEVHHRRFHLRLAEALGHALPGATLLDSTDALGRHLAAGGADAGRGAWVVKAPFSAAGRGRVVHGPEPLAPTTRRRLDRLFTRHGELLFEPWMDRTEDFGMTALVAPPSTGRAATPLEPQLHRLHVDRHGQCTAIELLPGDGFSHIPAQGARTLRLTLDAAAEALGRRRFSGPFGVDAWRFQHPNGALDLHPLGELNARMTLGWVARLWREFLVFAGHLPADAPLRLVMGRADGPEPTRGHALVLLRAAADDPRRIWLEGRDLAVRPQPWENRRGYSS